MRVQLDAKRFMAKALFLGAVFYGVSLLLSALFSQAVDWRSWQDPRKRLLYEPVPANSDIIVLGDSVWISSYVKLEADTLWSVLEQLTGKRVFNASLNGADPADFLNAVRLLPKREGKPAVVFLDVVPTRLLPRTFSEPAAGNYAGDFSRLIADNPMRRVFVALRRPLLIFNTDVVLNCILRKRHFSVGDDRFRVWARDGDFALKRFRTFERYVADTDTFRRPDWIMELHTDLARKGYRLVIVVTPVNQSLIKEYAGKDRAESYQTRIGKAHDFLVQFLRDNRIEWVDCYADCDSDCFADLIHTNARGDKRMAERMADYLVSSAQGAALHQSPASLDARR
jgi:hypothetical protein